MVQINCECGKFKAEISSFPKETPGRCVCYCDDCQTYLHYIGRSEFLDANGGTEIIPVYPADFKILQGHDKLMCVRLGPKGLYRWSTSCCKTPVGNVMPKFPWVGTIGNVYNTQDPSYLEKNLGKIKSRIFGKFAYGTLPEGISQKTRFKDLVTIFPFLLKGFLKGKGKKSPFFKEDGMTAIVEPYVLAREERNQIRTKLGFAKV